VSTLNALAIALQGMGYSAALVAVQGLLAIDIIAPLTPSGSGGGKIIGKPWYLPVYTPVHARRPRKRRHADMIFL
jgi:hypothetical protein